MAADDDDDDDDDNAIFLNFFNNRHPERLAWKDKVCSPTFPSQLRSPADMSSTRK